MDVYLAGGSTGNNNYIWRKHAFENPQKAMNVFLAGTASRPFVVKGDKPDEEKEMNIHLAALNGLGKWLSEELEEKVTDKEKIFVLESFYYIKDWMLPYIKNHWHFMLDSGAFTFMQQKGNGKVDWEKYIFDYGTFIKDNNIELFLELDIDVVVGLKEVKRLRDKLEKFVGRRCIPVWHKSRGLDYWKMMVQEYDYVAIGGIVTQEIKKKDYGIFRPLLQLAKENNCKVHGLGFTNTEGMQRYRFDSVDSTAWLYGNRGGFLYQFNGKTIDKINKPKGMRMKSKAVAIHNFREWVKFQHYARTNL